MAGFKVQGPGLAGLCSSRQPCSFSLVVCLSWKCCNLAMQGAFAENELCITWVGGTSFSLACSTASWIPLQIPNTRVMVESIVRADSSFGVGVG